MRADRPGPPRRDGGSRQESREVDDVQAIEEIEDIGLDSHRPAIAIEQSPITMKGIAVSADLVESGAISGKILKDLYDLAFERGQDFPAASSDLCGAILPVSHEGADGTQKARIS